ncbi:MAG: hypothetical protein DHS80DRAFT_18845 [Piptocephalis tieghemiana]|nr:MAG: hypothetical protein DHS80DRAFT_18845 [Piptocephalis tieghemiana]
MQVEPLLDPAQPIEAQRIAMHFIISCSRAQYDRLGILRLAFYEAIRKHEGNNDYELRIKALGELTQYGRDITFLERSILPTLLLWAERSPSTTHPRPNLTKAKDPNHAAHLLAGTVRLLQKVIQLHFGVFEDREAARTIRMMCLLFDATSHPSVAKQCMEFLEVVVPYGQVPDGALGAFVRVLCRSVTTPHFGQVSWRIMQDLLGSHAAFTVTQRLCSLLEEERNRENGPLLRGAVFFLGMSSWGAGRMETLSPSYARILSCLLKVTAYGRPNADYEILINVNRLVGKFASTLSFMEWDYLFDILVAMVPYVRRVSLTDIGGFLIGDPEVLVAPPLPAGGSIEGMIGRKFLEVVARLHTSIVDQSFTGPHGRFLHLVESLPRSKRSPSTQLLLLDHAVRSRTYYPPYPGWLAALEEEEVWRRRWTIGVEITWVALELAEGGWTQEVDLHTEELGEEGDGLVPGSRLDEGKGEDGEEDHSVGGMMIQRERMTVDEVVDRLVLPLAQGILISPSSTPETSGVKEGCLADDLARGLIQLFKDSLYRSEGGGTCLRLWRTLLSIIASSDPSSGLGRVHTSSRLLLLSLCFRLHVGSDHRIYVGEEEDEEEEEEEGRERRGEEEEERKGEEGEGKGEEKGKRREGVGGEGQARNEIGKDPRTAHVREGRETRESARGRVILPLGPYLKLLTHLLERERAKPIFSLLLKGMTKQAGDRHLFCGVSGELDRFQSALCEHLQAGTLGIQVLAEEGGGGGLREDIQLRAYALLAALLAYRRLLNRGLQERLVSALMAGVQAQAGTTVPCVHALWVCCHELPQLMTKMLPFVLHRMSRIISSTNVSVHLLEFLSAIATLPALRANFHEQEYQLIFAIALQYIRYNNMTFYGVNGSSSTSTAQSLGAQGPAQGMSGEDVRAFRQYVLLMAFRVITVWFQAVRVQDRKLYVPFITRRLLQSRRPEGSEQVEACLDMLARHAYADGISGRVERPLVGMGAGAGWQEKSWIVGGGGAVLSVRTGGPSHLGPGWAEVVVRRASGAGSFLIRAGMEQEVSGGQDLEGCLEAFLGIRSGVTEESDEGDRSGDTGREERLDVDRTSEEARMTLPIGRSKSERIRREENGDRMEEGESGGSASRVDPCFFFLQLVGLPDWGNLLTGPMTHTLPPPLLLPEGEMTDRALRSLDRTPVVEFHKIGVLYVGPGQRTEQEILGNEGGSLGYTRFLAGLGSLMDIVRARERGINTGGLMGPGDPDCPTAGGDGRWTRRWRGEGGGGSEVLFHIPTLMPTDRQRDPAATGKKRHIGNDFVTIIYDDSGLSQGYVFDTVPSQFNFFQIVVRPLEMGSQRGMGMGGGGTDESWMERTYYQVKMQRRPDLPAFGPAGTEPRVLSEEVTAPFVRQLALHANIVSQVWWQARGGHEYLGIGIERLRQIRRLRDRVMEKRGGMNGSGGGGPGVGGGIGGGDGSGVGGGGTRPRSGSGQQHSSGGMMGGGGGGGGGGIGGEGGDGGSGGMSSGEMDQAKLEGMVDFTRYS